MNIEDFFAELDNLFATGRINEVDGFLQNSLKKARLEKNDNVELSILNEIIGYYRSVSRFKDATEICEYTISKMKSLGYEDTISYGTTLLNVATTYRALGDNIRSLEIFKQVQDIFGKFLDKNDSRMAGLYNNMSVIYQEQGMYSNASELLEKSLSILRLKKDSEIESAIVLTNLSIVYFNLGKDSEAIKALYSSLEIFINAEKKSNMVSDPHYGAALAGMAEACCRMKLYKQAVKVYKLSLEQIETKFGRNKDYAVTCKNCSLAYKALGEFEESEKFLNISNSVMNELR